MIPATSTASSPTQKQQLSPQMTSRRHLISWSIMVLAGLAVYWMLSHSLLPWQARRLLAIFVATIFGLILQPMPGGAIVLFGVMAMPLSGALPVAQSLVGYADPVVWLVLAAFFISRGMIKTGLGRRIAYLFIRKIGHTSLGLGYALISTDMLLAMVIPSNGARAGGILFPIGKSLSEAYQSWPQTSARRLGAFLMTLMYQCDVIICAMFLTGQASNVLIAKMARQETNVDLSYSQWALGAIVPGLVGLWLVPILIYRVFPPDIRHTPEAHQLANDELAKMGPMSGPEKVMLLVFALVAALWMTSSWHMIDASLVALLGVGLLLLSGVLDWNDALAERAAWDVFIWYGGLLQMAKSLSGAGVTQWFAQSASSLTVGWSWGAALALLLLIYFYVHYGFASITAHATAMYIPFLVVILAAGAPPYLAVLLLAYFSNLNACLTHFGTTPAPIYFGAGYVNQRTWWQLGFLVSILNIMIWAGVGLVWWRFLGWW